MEWDIDKLGVFLEKKAREGVAIENKIFEWCLAEQKLKATRDAQSISDGESNVPVAKVG